MELTRKQIGSVLVLAFAEPIALEGNTSALFKEKIRSLIGEGRGSLVIDMGSVGFIDSSGLGSLISALKVLRARLFEQAETERKNAEAADRKNQVGSGDRSERIRTYNFPQNRVTDHRIGLTLYKLDLVMDGNLSKLIEALTESEAHERLAQIGIEQ